MVKNGQVERVRPGLFRLAATASPAASEAALGLAARMEALMARGGLWRIVDLSRALDAKRSHAEDALRWLSASGRATHVVLNHWRLVEVACDLERDGRTSLVKALGVLLQGAPVANADMANRLGITAVEVTRRVRTLLLQDLAAEVGLGLYQCPEEVADTILSQMEVAPRPAG